MGRKLIIILGPTAVGKTDFGIETALGCGSPVISCDSRQIYKEMSIGTAVPDASRLAAVRHYFIQTESVRTLYTAGDYERDALALIGRLFSEGHDTLVMVGGSMLYMDAVCNGLDEMPDTPPALRAELTSRLEKEGLASLTEELLSIDPAAGGMIALDNPRRVLRALELCLSTGKPYSSFRSGRVRKRDFEIEKIGLSRPRKILYERIDRRVLDMMDAGLPDEVRSLRQYRHLPALNTVGYRELFDFFDGRISLDEAVSLIQQNSRHYAKRQLTWWRRDKSVRWLEL